MKSPVMRRLAVVLAVACLLIPAWSFAGRVYVHFVADFDQASSTDTADLLAKGGVFVVQGPPGVFTVTVDGAGEGILKVADNGFQQPGVLTGILDKPAYDSEIDLSFDVTPSGSISDLVVSLIDDNGGGMIDLIFDDDDGGKLVVDGVSMPLNGGGTNSGTMGPISVWLNLKGSLLNVNSWQVTVTDDSGTQVASGFLPLTGPLSLAKIRFIRPGATANGLWTIDDLVISSPLDPGAVVQ